MLHRVVFDTKYTSVLLRRGIDEELLSIRGNPDAEFLKGMIAPKGHETGQLAQEALWQIVLHDEAYCNWRGVDNIDLDNGVFDECVKPLPIDHDSIEARVDKWTLADASYVHEILLMSGVDTYSKKDVGDFISGNNDGTMSRAAYRDVQAGSHHTYEDYVAFKKALYDLELELSNRRGQTPKRLEKPPFKPELTQEEFEAAIDNRQRVERQGSLEQEIL